MFGLIFAMFYALEETERMNILIISGQDMILHAYKMYGRTVLGRVNFIIEADIDRKNLSIDAVLIDARQKIKPNLKNVFQKYAQYPIFLIAGKRKRKQLSTLSNISGIFRYNLSIRKIVKSIEIILGLSNSEQDQEILKLNINVKERLILECLAQGDSNKEIARDFGLSLSTVKYYIRTLYMKLNVNNRAQAALIAREIIV